MTRLDKYLCDSGGLTRSEAKRALAKGMVTVNGKTEKNAALKMGDDDRVALRGEPLEPAKPRYLMLHKPPGFVCTAEDDTHPSVLELVDLPRRERLHAAGRLDQDTTGLVLLTDDGEWSHRVTSPKSACGKKTCGKTYLAELAEPVTKEAAQQLREGVMLRNEETPTLPAELELLSPTKARLTIYEGRYHQVKRMFAATGNRVTALHRERIGTIALDPDLEPGECRYLTEEEVASLGGEEA